MVASAACLPACLGGGQGGRERETKNAPRGGGREGGTCLRVPKTKFLFWVPLEVSIALVGGAVADLLFLVMGRAGPPPSPVAITQPPPPPTHNTIYVTPWSTQSAGQPENQGHVLNSFAAGTSFVLGGFIRPGRFLLCCYTPRFTLPFWWGL